MSRGSSLSEGNVEALKYDLHTDCAEYTHYLHVPLIRHIDHPWTQEEGGALSACTFRRRLWPLPLLVTNQCSGNNFPRPNVNSAPAIAIVVVISLCLAQQRHQRRGVPVFRQKMAKQPATPKAMAPRKFRGVTSYKHYFKAAIVVSHGAPPDPRPDRTIGAAAGCCSCARDNLRHRMTGVHH